MNKKPIQIGVITVRGMDYHPTRRLAEAARARSCCVFPIHPYRVWPTFKDGQPALAGDMSAHHWDAVLPRQGAEIKDACLPLIGHLEQMGVPVVNSKAAVEKARHKFFTLQTLAAASLPVPETTFVTALDGIQDMLLRFGAQGAVVKPVSGRQGSGVCRLQVGDALSDQMRDELDRGRGLLMQQYLAPEGRRDLRVIVIGQAVAAAVALTPAQGEFRANVHLGGQGRPVTLPAEMVDLALKAVQALGLQIAGVDIMIDADDMVCINEVNYAPGFRGLEAATGQDIAGAMIDYVLEVIEPNSK